jgi:hypothetical protein
MVYDHAGGYRSADYASDLERDEVAVGGQATAGRGWAIIATGGVEAILS